METKKAATLERAAFFVLKNYPLEENLFHVSKKVFHFVFVNDHLLVRVFAGNGIFHGFYHFHVVFAGAGVGSTLGYPSVFRNFLSHVR